MLKKPTLKRKFILLAGALLGVMAAVVIIGINRPRLRPTQAQAQIGRTATVNPQISEMQAYRQAVQTHDARSTTQTPGTAIPSADRPPPFDPMSLPICNLTTPDLQVPTPMADPFGKTVCRLAVTPEPIDINSWEYAGSRTTPTPTQAQ